ncbi:hypothetical protein [Mangrovibacterium sp.]|uniref:hypothetical protein n=1 Tax=Mangrovibacterium sp. TaxID=1961364 RepID=UPI0035659211
MRLFALLYISLISFSVAANSPVSGDGIGNDSIAANSNDVDTTSFFVPSDFKEQVSIALSYYPELKGKKLRFKFKNQKTTMSCIPRWDFIFRKKENRTYLIRIDKKLRNGKGILLEDVPFNAQVGVIGHELGHVVDYESKTAFGVIGTGFGYLFPKYRRELEHFVDEISIYHGLGHQLASFSDYVFHQSQASEKYLRYKRKYYFQPEQIQSLMRGSERPK